MASVVEPTKEARGWVVRVSRGGKELLYRYATEAQARYFCAVFALGPSSLPRRHLSKKPRREKPSDESGGRNVLEVDEPLPQLADQIRRTL